MRKSTIWIIIISMSVALIGLCGFQVYWINNAIALNEERFDRTVRATLNEVVEKLERREAIEVTARTISAYKDRSDWVESIHVKRTDSLARILINPDCTFHTSSKLFISTDTSRFNLKMSDSANLFFGDTALIDLKDRLTHKSEMVDVVIKQFVTKERDISERLSYELLDSLLNKGLHDKGVHTSFEFAVWNSTKDTLVFTNATDDFALVKDPDFKAGLFPNDLFGNVNYLTLNFPNQGQYLFNQIWGTLAASVLFVIIIVGSFSYAIFIIFRQKKLSDIKNDFINNMTHEFKTPIATVSLACEAMQEDQVRKDEKTLMRYLGMIRDENQRLGDQVEKVLQAAILEKDSFELKIDRTNLLELLQPILDKVQEQVNAIKGELTVDFNSKQNELMGDRHHLTNLFYNLLDNAIKYSRDRVNIFVRTFNEEDTVCFEVRDQGIGMKREELNRIFDKFYRVSTGDRHDVKGFGLGLNYVKTIVSLHNGSVSAVSEPLEGSSFTVKLPLNNE
ncbi:MAG: HAMP domain-containing sensor histidine kinase [Bacteroidota bacterium]